MNSDLVPFTWPASRLGEVLYALAHASGLAPRTPGVLPSPDESWRVDVETLSRWMEAAAAQLGLEAEPVETPYGDAEGFIRRAGPALLRLPVSTESRYLALIRGGRRWLTVLGPDRTPHQLRPERVRAALCQEPEGPLAAEVDRLLDEAGVPERRRSRARATVLRERLAAQRIGDGWLLRPSPGGSVWTQVRHARLPRRLLVYLGAYTVGYALWIGSWGLLGRGALQGRLDPGWLAAWALLLLTLVTVQVWVTWTEGRLAVGLGALLKRRLLCGALRLAPDQIRHQGVGQLLGRVIESEAVEALALSGGFLTLLAVIELVMATAVLALGAGGVPHALLLLGWVMLIGIVGWRAYRLRGRWTDTRLAMTHGLVEKMAGHRTRLAQGDPTRWHENEDEALVGYLEQSRALDRVEVALLTSEDGWLIVALSGLAAAFVSSGNSLAGLAVGLGGVLLAHQALKKLNRGLWRLGGAIIAWRQVAPLFQAAARPQVAGTPVLAHSATPAGAGPLLDARDLVFRYHDRGEPVLRGCSLQVWRGDRLLLDGPSGGGKSTLVSLLTGLRRPESGLLLLHGLDQAMVGSEGWRRRVVSAPQFHENHVFTETFLFNLLMGRRWPPQSEDLAAAEAVCRELGLGELLDRMPAGLLQLVGESGWQLSHGEKSRLYIARALLQGADLVVLDESFAAIDPETMQHTLRCVLDRAPTLVVIAHP